MIFNPYYYKILYFSLFSCAFFPSFEMEKDLKHQKRSDQQTAWDFISFQYVYLVLYKFNLINSEERTRNTTPALALSVSSIGDNNSLLKFLHVTLTNGSLGTISPAHH